MKKKHIFSLSKSLLFSIAIATFMASNLIGVKSVEGIGASSAFAQKYGEIAVDTSLVTVAKTFTTLNYTNLSSEKSGSLESISVVDNAWLITAGGYNADTHYARLRYKLPENEGVSFTKFYVSAEIELPADFYEKQEAGFRILGADNYGATSGYDEFRPSVYISSGHEMWLWISHENGDKVNLYRSTKPLPVGAHKLELYGDVSQVAPWYLKIDGAVVASGNNRLSPDSVPESERVITRLYTGIDGAADQDNKQMSVLIKSFVVANNDLSGMVAATPTSASVPSPLQGLSWEAEQGEITPPFAVVNGVVLQNTLTQNPADGGRALYRFSIQEAGEYKIKAIVKAADASSNSIFVGMDSEPDTSMIWDVPLTNGFEEREVFWRDGISPDGSASAAKLFTLVPGEHILIFRGREIGTLLDKVEVAKVTLAQPTIDATSAVTVTPIPTQTPTLASNPTVTASPVITPNPNPGQASDTNRIYVSLDGSDANPGTLEQPFASVLRAIDSALDGDTIFIKSGTYDLGGYSTNLYKTIQLVGEDPNTTILTNGKSLILHKAITVKNLTFRNFEKTNYYNAVFRLIPNADEIIDGLVIENCVFDNVPSAVSGREGTGTITNVTIINNTFININSQYKTFPIAITKGSISNIVISGNTFQNIYSTSPTADVVSIFIGDNGLFAENVLIKNNTIQTVRGATKPTSSGYEGAGRGILVYGDYVQVLNNRVSDIDKSSQPRTCIYLKADNSVIDGNILDNCGSGSGGDITFKKDIAVHNIISNNIITGNQPGGVGIQAKTTAYIFGNSVNRPGIGILMYSQSDDEPVYIELTNNNVISDTALNVFGQVSGFAQSNNLVGDLKISSEGFVMSDPSPTNEVANTLTAQPTITETLSATSTQESAQTPAATTIPSTENAETPVMPPTSDPIESPDPVSPTLTATPVPPSATLVEPSAPTSPFTETFVPPAVTETASLVPVSSTPAETLVPPTPIVEPNSQSASEIVFDDKDSAFVYSGWLSVGKKEAYGGTYRLATAYGSFATLDFTGQSFSVLYKSGSNFKKVNVYVDNILVGTIDQQEQPQVWQKRWDYTGLLASGPHTLKLVFVSPGGKGSLDAVIVRSTEAPAPVSPSPTTTSIPPTTIATETVVPMSPTPTATSIPPTDTVTASPIPSSSTPTATSVPPTSTVEPTTQPALEIIYDDRDSAFAYSGWLSVGNLQAYGSSFRLATTYGSVATLEFTGQSLSVLYKSGPDYRKVNVYVDDIWVGTIDQYEQPQVWQKRWDYPGQLTPGAHTLKLVFVSPGGKGSIDAVIVR